MKPHLEGNIDDNNQEQKAKFLIRYDTVSDIPGQLDCTLQCLNYHKFDVDDIVISAIDAASSTFITCTRHGETSNHSLAKADRTFIKSIIEDSINKLRHQKEVEKIVVNVDIVPTNVLATDEKNKKRNALRFFVKFSFHDKLGIASAITGMLAPFFNIEYLYVRPAISIRWLDTSVTKTVEGNLFSLETELTPIAKMQQEPENGKSFVFDDSFKWSLAAMPLRADTPQLFNFTEITAWSNNLIKHCGLEDHALSIHKLIYDLTITESKEILTKGSVNLIIQVCKWCLFLNTQANFDFCINNMTIDIPGVNGHPVTLYFDLDKKEHSARHFKLNPRWIESLDGLKEIPKQIRFRDWVLPLEAKNEKRMIDTFLPNKTSKTLPVK